MHNNIYLRVINQAIVNLSYIYKNKPTHILYIYSYWNNKY